MTGWRKAVLRGPFDQGRLARSGCDRIVSSKVGRSRFGFRIEKVRVFWGHRERLVVRVDVVRVVRRSRWSWVVGDLSTGSVHRSSPCGSGQGHQIAGGAARE
jgi:hypothetical protein